MKWPWQTSDAEFVKKTERTLRWYRPIGTFLLWLSVFHVGAVAIILFRSPSNLAPVPDDQCPRCSLTSV